MISTSKSITKTETKSLQYLVNFASMHQKITLLLSLLVLSVLGDSLYTQNLNTARYSYSHASFSEAIPQLPFQHVSQMLPLETTFLIALLRNNTLVKIMPPDPVLPPQIAPLPKLSLLGFLAPPSSKMFWRVRNQLVGFVHPLGYTECRLSSGSCTTREHLLGNVTCVAMSESKGLAFVGTADRGLVTVDLNGGSVWLTEKQDEAVTAVAFDEVNQVLVYGTVLTYVLHNLKTGYKRFVEHSVPVQFNNKLPKSRVSANIRTGSY